MQDNECDAEAKNFCTKFLTGTGRPRLIFGINSWADLLASKVPVDGFIDDFTKITEHAGKPVYRLMDVPHNALVVSAVAAQVPQTAVRRLREAGIEHLDCFAFERLAGISGLPIFFLDEFVADYKQNQAAYDDVRSRMASEESIRVYDSLINFRLSRRLSCLDGFTDRQSEQYFEPFLPPSKGGEVFADVGGFDGYTSLQFIKFYPDYAGIHLFEPENRNFEKAKYNLASARNVHYHQLGLSDKKQTLRFSARNSASTICEEGEVEVKVDRLDDVIDGPVSLIKMDIEGGESAALAGAQQTIKTHHPVLAIAVYHKYDDFRAIPAQVLSYYDGYRLNIRHYTEGLMETVMFFMPIADAR